MFEPISFSEFVRRFPVSTAVIAILSAAFLLQFFHLIPPNLIASTGRTLSIDAWSAHLFHRDIFHLTMNLLSFLLAGRALEPLLGSKLYGVMILLIWNILVLLIYLLSPYFAPSLFLGSSGVALGVLTFGIGVLALHHQRALQQLFFLLVVINLLIGIIPGIFALGHALGALAGIITFLCWKYLCSTWR